MKSSFSLWLRLSARLCLGLVCALCLALGAQVRPAHSPPGITVGPAGNLWFAGQSANQVGQLR